VSVQDRTDATGMRYHWDKWSNGCGSQYRDWDTSQPNGGIGYYDFEDQNCVVMGFFQRPQWWDVNCTRYASKCVCEMGGDYSHASAGGGGGGCISGFGVFMLILVFAVLAACGAYLYARPEKAAALKAKLMSLRRGRVVSATAVSREGLAANDGCSSTSYVAPSNDAPLPPLPAAIQGPAYA
jgi:hypothetical protein